MGVNKVNLVGRLGKDPELRYIEKNVAIAQLNVAVKTCDYEANGEKSSYTAWITVILRGRLAFIAKKRLYKGAAIAVEGRLSNRSYEDKNGVRHYLLEVEAERVEWLSSKKTSSTERNDDDATDENVSKVELENVLGSIEEKGRYEVYGDMAIEKTPLGVQEAGASEELSINDVTTPTVKRRGRKKKIDTETDG